MKTKEQKIKKSSEVKDYVLTQFKMLENESALNCSKLIEELTTVFPHLFKDKTAAANRVNSILKQNDIVDQFKKIKGKDNKPYIVRNQQIIF